MSQNNPCDATALSAKGRQCGQSNFKPEEDEQLALAYVKVSTDAAVGTDQTADKFWAKVHNEFNYKRLAGTERSQNSLSNRFNNVLQKDVSKLVGHLAQSLREYHSGWQMQDYVEDAKRKAARAAQRPLIGKKKAKKMRIEHERGMSSSAQLARIADATEKKNGFIKEHIMMEVFKIDPDSEESKRFFSLKRKQYMNEIEQEMNRDNEDVV
ncbi:hypothetical protein AeRB84_003211 [Aphanomyces euteiches]|nr:hypothetical protein AeRB84_003211 [Aphanomyces euteiches]